MVEGFRHRSEVKVSILILSDIKRKGAVIDYSHIVPHVFRVACIVNK